MISFELWRRWLLAVCGAIVLFGLALALANQNMIFNLAFNNRVDPVFWPNELPPKAAKAFQQWVYGVLGATVAGWGVAMAFIAAGPFRRKERWSWNCLTASLGLWFIVDTTISAAFGVGINVAFNVLLLIAVGLPLAFTHAYFGKRR